MVNCLFRLFVTKATIAIIASVAAKVMAMTTATTPPMIAAVLSDCGVIVAMLSDVVMGIVTEGLAVVHCGSPKELMTMEQLLSTPKRKPCTAIVESA